LGRARQTLKLATWFQSDPARAAAWAVLIHRFNASQIDYKVIMGGWSADVYANEVLLQASVGRLDADLILLLPELGPRLMRAGLLAALDDVVAKVGVHPTSAHDFMRRDGHLYGLGMVEVPFALVYNQRALARAGIREPASTIAGWQGQLERLTHKTQRYGLWLLNARAELASWWFQLQEFCLAYDTVWAVGRKPLLNSPRIIKGLELWKSLYTHVMPAGATIAQAQKLFVQGRIAEELVVPADLMISFKGTDVYPALRTAPPPWPTRKSLSRLHPLAVVASTRQMAGAKAFVEFMARPAQMVRLMQLCQDVVPPYPEVWQEPSFRAYMATQSWAQGFLGLKAVPFPDVMGDFIAHDAEFGLIVCRNLQRALHAGGSVAEAMDMAQQQALALGRRVFQ
jgi:ABC-type glycerol-3-phosphate transport system substrate-binding protein